MTTILICGGGTMQLPAIRIAAEEGMRVIVADGNAGCPGRAVADRFEHVDLNDLDGMTECARRHSVDGVFTAGTDFSTTVAWVAETLGLPGIDYATALRSRDKARMRRVLGDAGVLVPPFCVYENLRKVTGGSDSAGSDTHGEVPFPAVVKPVDNMGARGVRRIGSSSELESALRAATKESRTGRVLCESFIPGREYSIDAISYGGSVYPCGLADRHITFPPFFVEIGHTIPSTLSAIRRDFLERGFAAAVRALGIDPGAAKGDVFLVPRENAPQWLVSRAATSRLERQRDTGSFSRESNDFVVIGEIAARLSGGYMSGWTYPFARGFEPIRAALRIAVGHDPGPIRETRSRYAAERAIVSIPGQIDRIDGVEKYGHEADSIFLTRSTGQSVALPTSNVEKCANVIVTGDSYIEACDRADLLRQRIRVRLATANDDTELFLFSAENPILTAWDGDPEQSGPGLPARSRDLEVRASRMLDDCMAAEASGSGNTVRSTAPRARGNARENARSSLKIPDPVTSVAGELGREYTETGADEPGGRDIRAATRAQCIEYLVRHSESAPAVTVSTDFVTAVTFLAIERGGIQALEYLIDTISEDRGWQKLFDRIRDIRRS